MKYSILFIMLILLSMINTVAVTNAEQIIVADVYPAPIGFIYVLDHPIGEIVGYKTNGKYVGWSADTSDKTVFIPDLVSSVISKDLGEVKVKTIFHQPSKMKELVVDTGSREILLTSNNTPVYTSDYLLTFYMGVNTTDNIVIDPKIVDLRDTSKVEGYIIPVLYPDTMLTVIENNGLKYDMRISDLIGVEDTCITFTSSNMEWNGGLFPSPSCRKNIKPIVEMEYNGQVIYPVFSLTKDNKKIFIVFSDITVDVLNKIGLISEVDRDPSVHVYPIPREEARAYFYDGRTLSHIEAIKGKNSTVLYNGKYFCNIPSGAGILWKMFWTPSTNDTILSRELKPGEVVLFNNENESYICIGDTSFLYSIPSVFTPEFKQLHTPLKIVSDTNTLVITGGGDIYTGHKITIPHDIYDKNSLLIGNSHPYPVLFTPRSIYATPYFWFAVILTGIMVALLFERPGSVDVPITIEWDIGTPPPIPKATKYEITTFVKQYMNRRGVCPTTTEALLSGLLVDIDEEEQDPRRDSILCMFKTNPETEMNLRRLVDHLNQGFWAFVRRGKNYGFAYTLVGDIAPLFYVYKQEDERDPPSIIKNAIGKAMKTYIGLSYFVKKLGLIIVVDDNTKQKMFEEFDRYGVSRNGSLITDISNYVTITLPDLDEDEKSRLLSFLNEIPSIIIVGSDIREVVGIIGEMISRINESYLKKMGGGRT